MFGKSRKNSVENLPSVETAALRPHAQHRLRSSSPRRSSFHGSESSPQLVGLAPDETPRHIKYATAPIISHEVGGQTRKGQKPAPPPKKQSMPEPTFQKTFIAMLNRKDTRKRRSQELGEAAALSLPAKPAPAISPKPASGVFYQSLAPGHQQGQRPPELHHAAHALHHQQFQKAESFHLQQQFFKAEPLHHSHLAEARPARPFVREQ